MSSGTKALIGCLVIVGLWIGFQSVNQPKPKPAPACGVAASGGG
jgi:hypothetical protein